MDGKKVQVEISLKDNLSKQLDALSNKVRSVAKDMEDSARRISNAFNNIKIGTDFDKQMNNIKKQMQNFKGESIDVQINPEFNGASLGNIGTTVASALSAINLSNATNSITQATAQMSNSVRNSFNESIKQSEDFKNKLKGVGLIFHELEKGFQGLNSLTLDNMLIGCERAKQYFENFKGSVDGANEALEALDDMGDILKEINKSRSTNPFLDFKVDANVENELNSISDKINSAISKAKSSAGIEIPVDVKRATDAFNILQKRIGELRNMELIIKTKDEEIEETQELIDKLKQKIDAFNGMAHLEIEEEMQLGNLSDDLDKQTASMKILKQERKSYAKIEKQLKSEISSNSHVFNALNDKLKETSNKSKEASNSVDKLKNSFSGLKGVLSKVMSMLGVYQLIRFGKSAIDTASSLTEVQNVVDMVFNKIDEGGNLLLNNAKVIDEWAERCASAFGSTTLEMKKFASTFGAMFSASGINNDDYILTMSKNLSQLSGDLASFYNISNEQAFEKLQSGISGMVQPLRELGISISVANMENFMLQQGIDATWDSLSEANKQIVRYNYIMQTTAMAQGDFVRTQNSYANSVRQLTSSFAQLKQQVGTSLIAILQPVIKVIATIINYLTVLWQMFNKVFGLFGKGGGGGSATGSLASASTGMGGLADSVGGVGNSLDDATGSAKALKKELKGLMSIDEINKLSGEDKGSGSGGSGGGGAGGGAGLGDLGTDGLLDIWDEDYTHEIESALEEIKKKIEYALQPFVEVWNRMKPIVTAHLNELKAKFEEFKKSLSNLFDGIWNSGGKELVQSLTLLGMVVGDVAILVTTTLLNAFSNFFDWVNPKTNAFTANFITALTNLVGKVSALIYALSDAFATFFNNGGQAFINVVGDIISLVGTILARVLADAINLITNFINSWAGHAIITACAIALDVVAGVIKAVLTAINYLIPVIYTLGTAFGVLALSKLVGDFTSVWTAIAMGTTPVNALTTLGGKLAVKLSVLKGNAILAKEGMVAFAKQGVDIALKGLSNLVKGLGKAIDVLYDFFSMVAKKCLTGLKSFANFLKNPIQGLKNLGTAVLNNVKAFATWIATLAQSAWSAISNFVTTCATGIASALGLSGAISTATVSTLAFKVAMDALGIGLIITAIVLLIKHFDGIVGAFKKMWQWAEKLPIIGSVFKAISSVVQWLAEKIGWLWNKVKEFFGWKSEENGVEEGLDNATTSAEELGEEITTTADRFGTASSSINQYLDSINFPASKLAEQCEQAMASMEESIGKMSGNAQEYLTALAEHDEEKLAEMSADSSKYHEEILYSWNKMNEEERNQFSATYGIIQGINDDWYNYTDLTYNQAVARHVSYCESIMNNEQLTAQEKDRLIAESEAKVMESYNNRVQAVKDKMAEELAQEGLTQSEKYRIQYEANQKLRELEDEKNNYTVGGLQTVEEAITTSAEKQKGAYKEVADSQKQSLEEVNTSLEESSTNLEEFAETTKEITKKVVKSWSGIGNKISKEFKSINTTVPTIFKNMSNQITSSVTKLSNTIKTQCNNISNSMITSFTKAGNSIKTTFNTMANNIQTSINKVRSTVVASVESLRTSVCSCFNSMSNQVSAIMSKLGNNLNSMANNVKNTLVNCFNTTANIIANSFNNVAPRINAQFNQILNSTRSFASNMNRALSGIGTNLGTNMAYSFRSAMNRVISNLNNQVIALINRVSTATGNNLRVGRIPMLAQGGVVNGATIAMIGEAGKEAVVPLERNTGWINNLAEKLGSKINNDGNDKDLTVNLMLDGKVVTATVVKNINQQTRLNGRSPLR